MSCKAVLTLAGVACYLIVRVAALRLTISPDHVGVTRATQTVTFTCAADLALTGCQFRWLNGHNTYTAGPLLDLSLGPKSLANTSLLDVDVTDYSYSGRGLGAGDCGVSLQVKGRKLYMIACRVRAESGGWTYAWADLDAHSSPHLPHTLTTREAVVLPGGEARFALKAQKPLVWCHFYGPRVSLRFDRGAQSDDSTGRHRYLGAGLEGGECGLAVSNVSEADNGPVMCWMWEKAWLKDTHRLLAVIVARPPSAPTMIVIYTDAGVTATCVVAKARPVAKILWFLTDVVVRQDSLDDSPSNPEDEWRWPWMQGSVLQRLTLSRQTKYNGKVLKCVVSHEALARPLEATEIISFTEPARATVPLAASSTTPGTTPHSTRGPSITLDPTCTAARMLPLLCREFRGLENTPCPRDEVYELRGREAGAAARTAELAEELAKVTLEAAMAEAAANATLAKVAMAATKSRAKAEEASKAIVAKLAEDQAKVTLEAAKYTLETAKAEKETQALLAKLAEKQAKITLEATKAEAATNSTLAKVAIEAARSSAKAEEETKATLAKLGEEHAKFTLEAVKSSAEAAKSTTKAEKARARKEEAWAKNAEEELQFERERRSQGLLQPGRAQS